MKVGDTLSLYETLFPFQKNIVDSFKDRERYGLFLDCGLGKTLVSLAFAEVNECTKVIVITINSKATEDVNVKGSWLWWASKSNIKYNLWDKKILHPTKRRPNTFSTATNDMLLLNFESLYSRDKNARVKNSVKKEIIDFVNACKGHNIAVIVDESHKIKDTSSVQNKAVNTIYNLCRTIGKKAYLYLGTGTIFTVGLIDTYAQLKILGWDGSKTKFSDAFCIRGELPSLPSWQQPIVGYKNIDALYDLIHQYGITIKSEDVIDLPERIFVDHSCKESKYFSMLTQAKYNQKELYDYMNSRGLPYLIDDKIYSKMTLEEKTKYWSRLHINITGEDLMLEGSYAIGTLSDSYKDIMNFLASVYDNLDELEGQFEWLIDCYYLFIEKKEVDSKGNIIKRWHECKTYKPNRKTNNPFYRNFAFPQLEWEAKTSGTEWMRARQMSSGFQGNSEGYVWYDRTRLDMLKEFLTDHENNYVLFYNYTPELIEIYNICEELGYNIDVYSGEIKSLAHYDYYESQTEDERFSNTKNIIISNFASGSTGKNWQLYNQCIIFSMPAFINYQQGIKRIHRTGQKSTCVYHWFFSENFLDEQMKEALEQNRDYTDDMFYADRDRLNKLMNEDDDDEE